MEKNNKKVPGAIIAIVAIIVAVAVFVPVVYMPYRNNKPQLDADHESAVSQIQVYDDAIADQANIEKNIEELQAEWDEFQKDMFVDASSSLDDLQKKFDEIGLNVASFNRGEETEDPSKSISQTGNPLYYVTINVSLYSDQEKLLELLKYVEEESVGCYYVKTLSATTVPEDEDLEAFTVKEGELKVDMQILLYYYNQDITIDPSLLETDTEATEGEEAAE